MVSRYLKPINCATVYKRGKLTKAVLESLPHRTHGKNYVQISLTLVHKILPHIWHCFEDFSFLCSFLSCSFHYLRLLITWIHIWHLTNPGEQKKKTTKQFNKFSTCFRPSSDTNSKQFFTAIALSFLHTCWRGECQCTLFFLPFPQKTAIID